VATCPRVTASDERYQEDESFGQMFSGGRICLIGLRAMNGNCVDGFPKSCVRPTEIAQVKGPTATEHASTKSMDL
jgi:hypothetical protein